MQIKIISILGAAVILMGVTLGFLIKRLDTVKTERDQAIEFNLAAQDSVEYYLNRLGQEIARTSVLDLTLRNVQRLRSDERLSWISKFDGVNKRMNNLESATRTVAKAISDFKIPIDSTARPDWTWLDDSTWLQPNVRTFDNHNEWIRIQGTVTPDTVTVHAEANVPIESVVVFERKKFLGLRIGRKQWFTETASPNPYVKITESTVIRVGKRKKR